MLTTIIPESGESLEEIAKRCDAYYICPKIGSVRKGPLVVYAGKDEQERNLVGDEYFNFAMIESHLMVVAAFAEVAYKKLRMDRLLDTFDTVCGIPEGGRTFAQSLAYITGKRFVYPTKKPLPIEPGKKQEYAWDFSRFTLGNGERVAIAEDVFNNFQNTDTTLTGLASTGASVQLLVGALNRSPVYDSVYTPKSGPLIGCELPVIASIRRAYPEYNQDDPAVAADIAAGNIEYDVKKNWRRLRTAMDAYG